jgi:hypothetical protein
MAQKVIVPQKKNYFPQFLKQRDINSYWAPATPPPPLRALLFVISIQRPNSWTKSRKKSKEFSSLLFTVTALPWNFYFFKHTQPLTVSLKEKGGKPDRKPYPPLPYGLRNPYRNLKSVILKIMPRNLNEIVSSWIRLLVNAQNIIGMTFYILHIQKHK